MSEDNAITAFSEDKIALLKQTICKGTTDNELELFIHACKKLGLDPFMKQIHAVKRGGVMTIQTGIDGYRLIADRSHKYMPGREPTYTYDDKGNLVSATSYVKKLGPDGTWHEIAANAIWSEYAAKNPMWDKMPHLMLAKCAETLALRRAFPAEMSGVYTEEEMQQVDSPKINKSTGEIEVKLTITKDQAENLERVIGGDVEYKQKILGFYGKLSDFSQLPSSAYDLVLQRATKWAEQKLEEELKNVPIKEEEIF